ncbi:MAG: TonB-dependent receptor, partial [Candidatus Aminicenantes bacterium]|nr:TonB-dependent receptor [Candidatus Aminicenantes bacterium]
EAGMAGFGAVGEGPLGKKGSWMFSARKSYLDLIVDAIGSGVAPRYSDFLGKAHVDLSPYLKLTAMVMAGIDTIKFSREDAVELDPSLTAYGSYKTDIATVGVTLRSLWPKAGFSDFSLSSTYRAFKTDYFTIAENEPLYRDATAERGFKFRNVNYLRITDPLQLQFGLESRLIENNYDYTIGPYTNIFGDALPAFSKDMDTEAVQSGVFANATWKPFFGMNFNLGVRADYYSFNDHVFISPRLSVSQKITERLSLVAAFGIFRQNLPLELAITFPENGRDLKDPKAYHYVLGFSHMLGESTMLTLEMYDKEYRNFPQDPAQPTMFLVDDFYVVGFQAHNQVVDTGRARSYGVELTLQKKLAKKLYGILCMAYFRARYLDLDGRWRPRIYDNQVLVSMEGGFKPNYQWEFSLRWTYAGGTPYTPFDMSASTALNTPIFDASEVNGARNPAYHALNLRIDKHWNFKKSNLTVYLNIWNAYDKKNIAQRYWNKNENKPDVIYQWRFIPMGGVEFEF